MLDFNLTEHAIMRMAQRGIQASDLELILTIGSEVGDGVLVRKKDIQAVEQVVRSLLKRLKRLEGKRLVLGNGHLITAYHATPRDTDRLLRH